MGERATTGAAVVDDGFMAPVGQAGIKIFPGRVVYNRPRPRISAPPPSRGEKKNGAISPRPSPSLSPESRLEIVVSNDKASNDKDWTARIPYNADNL